MSVDRLDPERAALVVIDVQEGFRDAVEDFDEVARATEFLVRGAGAVGIPVVVTEQYPKGLGVTAPEVSEALPEGVEPIEKVCFSVAEADGFDLAGRDQAILAGVEAHVCVNQTAIDLLSRGLQVHVAEDAVGSRFPDSKRIGLHKMEQAGAVLTSVETALFELVRKAGGDDFKQVHKLVLEYAPTPEREGTPA